MTLRTRLNDIRQTNTTQQIFALLKKLFRRKGRGSRIFMLFIIVPTLLIGIYLFLFHSEMYISNSNFALRTGEGVDIAVSANPLFAGASATTPDAFILQSYVSSMDMQDRVEHKTGWRAHFSDRSKDVYSRLKADPTREELLEYWQWVVSAHYSLDKGILSVEVRAYTPEMAKRINDAILEFSEELVNQINTRAHHDAVRLTKNEVAMAEERHFLALQALQNFRDTQEMLDPASMAQSLERIVAGLEAEAVTIRSELAATLSVMQKNSPKVITLQNRLQAVQEQIAKEKARLAGLDGTAQNALGSSNPLSSLFGRYTHLASEEKFAQERLLKAMEAAERARVRAIAQSRYIVAFQPPTLPQESLYPRPLLFTFLSFLFLLIVVGICALTIAAIMDHMGV